MAAGTYRLGISSGKWKSFVSVAVGLIKITKKIGVTVKICTYCSPCMYLFALGLCSTV